jgi:hypothetical protein
LRRWATVKAKVELTMNNVRNAASRTVIPSSVAAPA